MLRERRLQLNQTWRNDGNERRLAPAPTKAGAGNRQIGPATRGLEFEADSLCGDIGKGDPDSEQSGRVVLEDAGPQPFPKASFLLGESRREVGDRFRQRMASCAEAGSRLAEAAARESDRHAALEAEKHGTHRRQPDIGVGMEDASSVDLHVGDGNGGGIGRPHPHQVEVGRAVDARIIIRQRRDEGAAPTLMRDGDSDVEALRLQIGHPRQLAVEHEAIRRPRARAHLQLLDARQELHRVRQAGGAGHAASEQVGQHAVRASAALGLWIRYSM